MIWQKLIFDITYSILFYHKFDSVISVSMKMFNLCFVKLLLLEDIKYSSLF